MSDLRAASAAALVDTARDCSRAENIAAARKLAVMAELFDRRTALATAAERQNWWVDPDAAVAAELAAALGVTQGLALAQTHRAVALRDRLPGVAALFAQGFISDLLVRAIVYRTGLITDPAVMAEVDAALARQVGFWGALSQVKVEQAIDATVISHDPAAQRVPAGGRGRERRIEFGDPDDPPGLMSVHARMHAGDAAALRDRIKAIAGTVCEADPRTLSTLRDDALAAICWGFDALACRCGQTDCEGAARPAPTPNTTVYLITDTTTLDTAATGAATAQDAPTADTAAQSAPSAETSPGPQIHTDTQTEPAIEFEPPTEAKPAPAPSPSPAPKPALLFGAGLLPATALPPLLGNARIRTIVHPGNSPAEPRYLPSRALAEFIRCRDLTCRFPNCDIASTTADIDHTVPYPLGPTHASNLKALCRFHHLLKTFWTGPGGWYDRQHPDGTVEWTSPTGHTYITKPGSALLFPSLCKPTGILWTKDPPTSEHHPQRGAMMPQRRYTRAQAQARYIKLLRRLNEHGITPPDTSPPF
ncbi:DUF222 domain-containing protein [Mycolicibacterium vaccae]|uniref:HNH endonuclease signature motif containing protein n=1 Tax=Mycolicibacterium vaccae TaxID=1810 RepID=UPI003CF06FB6